MATERRLIDANHIVEVAKHAYSEWNLAMAAADGQWQINQVYKMKELCKAVKSVADAAPTVDAVEVVRCKDCRFCKKHPTSDKTKICTNERWNTEYHPFAHDEGFCSYGERRTNNEKS